jgi:hypothetical protein
LSAATIIGVSPVAVAPVRIGLRGEQHVDRRRAAVAHRDDERRIAVDVDAVGIEAANEHRANVARAIVGDGDEEVVEQVLREERGRERRRHHEHEEATSHGERS